jgi:hypothetical protein
MHMGVDTERGSAGRKGRCVVVRYGFNIKTKHGQRVENIRNMAASLDDAERRQRQMYHHCEIIECREQAVPRRVDALDMEGIIGLISASQSSSQPSGHKAGTH